MNWKIVITLGLLTFIGACKTIKQEVIETQYFVIELARETQKTYLTENYADFKIDDPRKSNRTLNQFIAGFQISAEQEAELISKLDNDKLVVKYSKSQKPDGKFQSSTNNAKAKSGAMKSSKH